MLMAWSSRCGSMDGVDIVRVIPVHKHVQVPEVLDRWAINQNITVIGLSDGNGDNDGFDQCKLVYG